VDDKNKQEEDQVLEVPEISVHACGHDGIANTYYTNVQQNLEKMLKNNEVSNIISLCLCLYQCMARVCAWCVVRVCAWCVYVRGAYMYVVHVCTWCVYVLRGCM